MFGFACLCDRRKDIRCDAVHCDLASPGAPGDPNQCRFCWLRLRGEIRVEVPSEPEPPPVLPVPQPARRPILERRRALEAIFLAPSCVHLGAPTGEQVRCDGCAESRRNSEGNVEKTTPVYSCALHGECVSRPASRVGAAGTVAVKMRECKRCEDYTRPARSIQPPWSMLLTGGIGDVFAVESLLTGEERDGLETVYYACPSAKEIVSLMQTLSMRTQLYPRLLNHVVLPTGKTTHYSIESVRKAVGGLPAGVRDFSIGKVFKQKRTYTGSSFLNTPLASISRSVLTALEARSFVVIVPGSDWGKLPPGRDFDTTDWRRCVEFLRERNLAGVVLRKECHPLPEASADVLVDLQGKTSIQEAVEVLKCADGYLGVDSCLSVLAVKLFSTARVAVKSIRPHLAATKQWYYLPRTSFDFITGKLEVPPWQ